MNFKRLIIVEGAKAKAVITVCHQQQHDKSKKKAQ